MRLPNYLVTSDEMRALDAVAIHDYGIPGVVLMENAGRSTFEILSASLSRTLKNLRVTVVAGPGNNGGDGYVVARYCLNHGAHVRTYLLAPREKIAGDALVNLTVLERMTDSIVVVPDVDSLSEFAAEWHNSDIIIDALLGTGLRSDVRSPYREAIELINSTSAFKVAIDIPSGVDSNSGGVLGAAVKADLTVTYGFRKIGMVLYPGMNHCGRVEVVDISIPRIHVEKNPPKAILYQDSDIREYVRIRSNPTNHKGTFGHLLIVGGSPGKTGAPALAARAGSLIGAGLVTVAVAASLNSILEVKLTEEMTELLPETAIPGYVSREAVRRVLELSQGKRCVVVGPGMSNNTDVAGLLIEFLEEYSGWVVIDADGLNALSGNLDALKQTHASVVLTPHPGELSRLTGLSVSDIQRNRVQVARDTAAALHAWIVLKGAGTVVASPEGNITINTTGSPWMASGGQGDVLSGILGGLLAQKMSPAHALPFGVHVHGLAADEALMENGLRPVSAGTVLEELPRALARLTGRATEVQKSGEKQVW
ncbi:MAG: ADP-dependent NAD(P)H-hydrate dehydratase / NAD(P)H-hydrate epimerase [Thermodesulfobacteriota bacterium]|nr:ADP-dependent NAD(P)H-hydrate dehydratase / NAD(P)H-hydrate epimerase [Thermodesulfobacteriota bacterium]